MHMPLDETKEVNGLLAKPEELSFVELQNRQGMRHESIRDLSPGYITVLVVDTAEAMSLETFGRLLGELKSRYGVRTMQTVFGSSVAEETDSYRYDLHLSAHLRIEARETTPLVNPGE